MLQETKECQNCPDFIPLRIKSRIPDADALGRHSDQSIGASSIVTSG